MSISTSIQQDKFFTDVMYHLAAREGEISLASSVAKTSSALDSRCRTTIRHAFRRVKKPWLRAVIAAAIVVVLLTTAVAASPALRRKIGEFWVIRVQNHTEFRKKSETQVDDPTPFNQKYHLELGYQPDLPLVDSEENDHLMVYSYGDDSEWFYVECWDMNACEAGLDSEGAKITELTVQGYPAELYDHETHAILGVLWGDDVLLSVGGGGFENSVSEVLRIAEELTIQER